MQFAADRPHFLDQHLFDVHMDIFMGDVKSYFAGPDLLPDRFQARGDRIHLIGLENTACSQHPHMGETASDIFFIQLLIKIDGCGVFFNESVGWLGEAPAPEFHRRSDPPFSGSPWHSLPSAVPTVE